MRIEEPLSWPQAVQYLSDETRSPFSVPVGFLDNSEEFPAAKQGEFSLLKKENANESLSDLRVKGILYQENLWVALLELATGQVIAVEPGDWLSETRYVETVSEAQIVIGELRQSGNGATHRQWVTLSIP